MLNLYSIVSVQYRILIQVSYRSDTDTLSFYKCPGIIDYWSPSIHWFWSHCLRWTTQGSPMISTSPPLPWDGHMRMCVWCFFRGELHYCLAARQDACQSEGLKNSMRLWEVVRNILRMILTPLFLEKCSPLQWGPLETIFFFIGKRIDRKTIFWIRGSKKKYAPSYHHNPWFNGHKFLTIDFWEI